MSSFDITFFAAAACGIWLAQGSKLLGFQHPATPWLVLVASFLITRFTR